MVGKKGFTLIELVVVVAIIGLVLAGALATFTSFRDRRVALRDAKRVVSELEAAHRKALAGEKPSACGASPMSGYEVSFSGATFSWRAVCKDVTLTPTDVTLVDSVVSSTVSPLVFSVLNGGTSAATVEVCGRGYRYQIQVTEAGSIGQPEDAGNC